MPENQKISIHICHVLTKVVNDHFLFLKELIHILDHHHYQMKKLHAYQSYVWKLKLQTIDWSKLVNKFAKGRKNIL